MNWKLISSGTVSTSHFIIDSKLVNGTDKNNFKNPGRNTRDSENIPRCNPPAALGYYSCQIPNGIKQIIFFWGYRTHIIVSKEGISLVSLTLPANLHDSKVAHKLIKKLR